DYAVRSVPFRPRGPEHLARQPFAQIPFLDDGEVTVFESGACLLYLGRKSEKLMPRDPQGEVDVTQWVIAGLNSVEMVTVPWWFIRTPDVTENPLAGWMESRFQRLQAVLDQREWLAAGRVCIDDI